MAPTFYIANKLNVKPIRTFGNKKRRKAFDKHQKRS